MSSIMYSFVSHIPQALGGKAYVQSGVFGSYVDAIFEHVVDEESEKSIT